MTFWLTFSLLLLHSSLFGLAQQKDSAPPGKLVDIGGYRLHLNCTGKPSPTVVLIAGREISLSIGTWSNRR